MFVVGVSGGIGSGKSAASHRFSQLGVEVVDADVASRVVVEPGTVALASIADHFGECVMQSDGTLDRAALRRRIFNNPEDKQWLEALLHPLIRDEIKHAIEAAKSPYVVFVSPLLIETDQHQLCNRVLVIDVPEQLQLQRTIARDNNDEAQVRRIMASQASRQQRLENADDVIENTAGITELEQEVDKLHQKYLAMASTS